METTRSNVNGVGIRSPFVIDVNLEETQLNSTVFNKYSILIEPDKHITVADVMNKLKKLFNLINKFYLVTENLSIIPDKETVEILHYIKKIRIQHCGDNYLQPKAVPVSECEISIIEEIRKSPSPSTPCYETYPIEIVMAANNIKEALVSAENKKKNNSKRYTKSFSVGDFLTNLRDEGKEHNNPVIDDSNMPLTNLKNNSEEIERNNTVDIDTPLPSTEQEDCPKKRKRTRRRRKKDVSLEESESEVSSSKYLKPYSFEFTAREESKHLRFTEDDNSLKKENAFSDEENWADSLIAEVDVTTQVEVSQLDALMSLSKTPVVFVRSPIISEKV